MFRHRLALALGRTLEELEAMPLAEFHSWIDFYQVEPWGDFRADLRSGVLASVIVRMLGAKGTAAKPLDFMPIVARNLERRAERLGLDRTEELRAAMLSGFKGRLRVVKITKPGERNGD